LVYPVLDAILVFPALLIFLAVARKTRKNPIANFEKQRTKQSGVEEKELSSPTLIVSPIWLLPCFYLQREI
jgi:hypothetical protein